jgi:hypothetical protein
MRTEASTDSGPLHSFERDPGAAITFDDMRPNDKIVIKTRNSEYQFSVSDPVNHKGMLSGGALGENPREAFLVESLSSEDGGVIQDFDGLKTGGRALFYLSSGPRIERVTTSKISGLRLVKAADSVSHMS